MLIFLLVSNPFNATNKSVSLQKTHPYRKIWLRVKVAGQLHSANATPIPKPIKYGIAKKENMLRANSIYSQESSQ